MSNVLDVKLVPVENKATNGDLAEKVYYECMFCSKRVGLYAQQRSLCEKLSGPDFYCMFCLRNGFYTKNNRNVLILSFRAIIGYYYKSFYLGPQRKMYFSEIEDYIKAHVKVGLENPVFYYDPDTMLWFIDFSKVGRGNKKIKMADVLKTISNILAAFNLERNQIQSKSLYEKYKESIDKFYKARWRPEGKKTLVPTLQGCEGYYSPKINMEETRLFTSDKLIPVY